MGSHSHEVTDAILETLKRAGTGLKDADVRFALAGGCAAYARGAAPSLHDVDFVLVREDVDPALEALARLGFRIVRPPEDWLVKAYDEQGHLVDLIFRVADREVTPDLIKRAEPLTASAVILPVLDATDLVISWLLPLSEHSCDYGSLLPQVRALREQVDWNRVASVSAPSPYASTFLTLLERLGVLREPAVATTEPLWP
ncbi:nucleotidyltransferase family protein [Spongiactinospora sp. TRM90649]|uniref:nucleotidyltransferase family protein n=1 Tax=Spongiactinospora sp. TRM90649 TaxID=3031114 RepID=UPI0023F9557E|nr:nucleotidyltransferase family protein [Spongiactinospora sp. TRM90649]MDF5753190.1 nucleotidyltransferase family protein [Spongiactinospora sp. TRM90649]